MTSSSKTAAQRCVISFSEKSRPQPPLSPDQRVVREYADGLQLSGEKAVRQLQQFRRIEILPGLWLGPCLDFVFVNLFVLHCKAS